MRDNYKNSNNKKTLIFGGGSKFGLELSNELHKLNHEIEIVTSSDILQSNFKIHKIDWSTLNIAGVEKLCKDLSNFNFLIFNQNYSKIDKLEDITVEKLKMWSVIQKWQQGQYINCQLPLQVCNSLLKKNKINNETKVVWILSNCININNFHSSLEYKTQKYINHEMVAYINNLNILKCVGLDPGSLDKNNYQIKARNFSCFLEKGFIDSKNPYYSFNDDNMVITKQKYFL